MTTAFPRARRVRARPARTRWVGLLFVLPALLVYGAFTITPAVQSVFYSFYEWDGINDRKWVGFDNYHDVATDPLLRSSITNALTLIVFYSVIPILAGLALTVLIARRTSRAMVAYRLVFFVPYVMPLVATGLIWRWMYARNGLVNQILSSIGLVRFATAWLGDLDLALPAIGVIGAWTLSGFCMMLFLAGAQKIDPSLYEASMLDGAGVLWQFKAVTLPALRGEISVALVVTTIAALASFDVVFVTTKGGPANSTVVPGLLVYRQAFNEQKIGSAAALAVVLAVFVVTVVGIFRRISREAR